MKPFYYVIAVLAALAVADVHARAGAQSTDEPIEPTEGPAEPEPTEGPTDPEPERPPQEGDSCNHELCRNTGYCQSYLRCDKDLGKLVREECGQGLVWNPKNANGTDHIHGGNCDTWENLPADVERDYRTDQNCLACFWLPTGECEAEYLYQEPNLRHRNVLRLRCADGLVFSPEKETCQLCSDVRRSDGSDCCGGASPAP